MADTRIWSGARAADMSWPQGGRIGARRWVLRHPVVMETRSAAVAAVASYALRLHGAAGERHLVASPLGAWLRLALCGSASMGGAGQVK